MTWVRLDGTHQRLKSGDTVRVYYVLSGHFDFFFDEDPTLTAAQGHTVVMDAGTTYGLTGTGEYLVINAPAFSEGDDQYV